MGGEQRSWHNLLLKSQIDPGNGRPSIRQIVCLDQKTIARLRIGSNQPQVVGTARCAVRSSQRDDPAGFQVAIRRGVSLT
jgi:hypothetical protein